MFAALLLAAGAYLVGSISFAVVVSRAFGLPDPHEYGSGNIGATNVLRTGNKAAALLTLLGDGLKGFVAVFAVAKLAPLLGAPAWAVPAAAIAVVGGHCWPVFHGFRGGKGVATGAGIVFALHWPLGLVLTVVWLTMAFGFKISSLAALTAGQIFASVSGLASGALAGNGAAFAVVIVSIVFYNIIVVALAILGILLIRRLFQKAPDTVSAAE